MGKKSKSTSATENGNGTNHVGLRIPIPLAKFIDAAMIDLQENFPGVEFSRSSVIRLMICGAKSEMDKKGGWLRDQVRK